MANEKEIRLRMAEKEIFEAVHGDVGAYLMGLWGMPGAVVEGIGFHHRLDNYPDMNFSPAVAVHVANTLYYEVHPDEVQGAFPEIDKTQLQAMGFEDKIEQWREIGTDYLKQGEEDD